MAPGKASDKIRTHHLKEDNLSSILRPGKPAPHISATKALVTLGPASREVDTLVELLEAGAACVRVDLTYGSVEYHRQSLRNLQEAVRKVRRLCAVVLDTFGRELVIRREYEVDEKGWPKPKGSIEIKMGQEVIVSTEADIVAHDNVLPIECSDFDRMCEPGDTLFIGRYLVNGADSSSLYLDVMGVEPGKVVCRAQNDAVLDGLLTVIHSEREADGMSSSQANLPLLTDGDKKAIRAMTREFDIDFIALTYTCSGDDVSELRRFLDSMGQDAIKIIAKVENRQALTNFESIATEADVVLLSRGNLGLDVPPEKGAIVQKAAINSCNLLGKPVVITRVVDTMATAPRCTRAEATDVANAVLDGVDGIMLGAETLRGKYPVEAVTTVLSICRQAEQVFNHAAHFDFLMDQAMEQDDVPRSGTSSPIGNSPRYSDGPNSVSPPQENGKPMPNGSAALNTKPPKNPVSQALPSINALARKSSGAAPVHKASSFGSIPRAPSGFSLSPSGGGSAGWAYRDTPNLSRAESMASTAVRAADKIKARLIVVYASSGRTASLVSKYRPQMPILTLVVPSLKSTALGWQMQGRCLARQLLCMRGVIPILSAPNVDGSSDGMLAEAIAIAAKKDLVGPTDHVVCLMSIKDSLVLKIVSIDELSGGRLSYKKGSHHDLAGLSTNAGGQPPPQSGLADIQQPHLAAPNITNATPKKMPSVKL